MENPKLPGEFATRWAPKKITSYVRTGPPKKTPLTEMKNNPSETKFFFKKAVKMDIFFTPFLTIGSGPTGRNGPWWFSSYKATTPSMAKTHLSHLNIEVDKDVYIHIWQLRTSELI